MTEPLLDAGADAANTPIVVRGRVVDFFLHALANVPVTIGSTTVNTDGDGQFAIAGIQAPYEVSLIVGFQRNNAPARYGYVYQGLTRSDPTLQVYEGGLPQRTGNLSVSLENADFSDPRRKAIFAFSSADGSFSTTLDADHSLFGGSWTGPAITTGFARVMLLSESDAGVTFEAEQASPVALQEGNTSRVSFDFDRPLPYRDQLYFSPLSESTGSPPASDVRLFLGIRYDDGTLVPLVDDPHGVGPYPVPLHLSGGTYYSAAGSIGDTAPFTLAHREHYFYNYVYLPLRDPASLAEPADQATVSAGTTFSWSWGSQYTPPSFSVWHLEAVNGSGGLYVVTNEMQIAWPALAAELIPPGSNAMWSVETHMVLEDWDSPDPLRSDVDSATGPNGFLDEYSLRRDVALGPNVTDGMFTESERRSLHVNP